MDNLTISQISNNNFELLGVSTITNLEGDNYLDNEDKKYNNNNINIKGSYNLLNELVNSINKNISDSVMDLTKCFICLCPVNEPLTCPNCNNFACKKCLQTYFEGSYTKKCPLCKQEIKFNELKKHQIISEIEKIMNKDNTRIDKVNELSNLIKEKKIIWKNEENSLNELAEKFLKCQDDLKEYKKEYDLFFLRIKNVIEKTFDEYEKKIQELIESIFSYNKDIKQSIIKYDEIDKKNKNNFYSNENIKVLINEILSMERKHINEENNKANNNDNKFSVPPIKMCPRINEHYIGIITTEKKNIFDSNIVEINQSNNNSKIGNYKIRYYFDRNKLDNLNSLCDFSFTLGNDRGGTFFVIQQKIINGNVIKVYPMKLKKHEGKEYFYESIIDFDEFVKEVNKITMKIIVWEFYIEK